MFSKKKNSHAKGDATTYISTGMRIEGKLRSVGPIRIDGEIQGEIDCESEVAIGPSAFIEATIHAARIVVNGKVQGNLFSDQLEVLAEGHIIGNVSTPPGQLVIHEGGVIEGQCITYDPPSNPVIQGKIDGSKTQLKVSSKNNVIETKPALASKNIATQTGS